MGEELFLEIHNLLFGLRRSIRYHNRRRSFFDGFQRFTNAVSITLGSAILFIILSDVGTYFAVTSAAIVTIFSAINLVASPSQKARLHEDLGRRFMMLERELINREREDFTHEDLRRFTVQRLEIEQEEPPTLYVLDAICHNELLRAMGYGKEYFVQVNWYQRLLANILDIRVDLIQPPAERQKDQSW